MKQRSFDSSENVWLDHAVFRIRDIKRIRIQIHTSDSDLTADPTPFFSERSSLKRISNKKYFNKWNLKALIFKSYVRWLNYF
jgi:hypothetical protein